MQNLRFARHVKESAPKFKAKSISDSPCFKEGHSSDAQCADTPESVASRVSKPASGAIGENNWVHLQGQAGTISRSKKRV
jgi:hypothetical protein